MATMALAQASTATVREQAWTVASRSVLSNIVFTGGKQYLLAGRRQFHTLWTRDLSMSVAGALEIGADAAVRDSLDALFAGERADGLIPRTIDNVDINRRVIGGLLGWVPKFQEPLKAWFKTEYDVYVIDSCLVVPWAASRYLERTGDLEAARRWYPAMQRALAFIENNYFEDGLVAKQPPYSDWEDSVQRTGKVALTNIYYVLALRGAAFWAGLLGDPLAALDYEARAALQAERFRQHFWQPAVKAVRNFDGDDHLTADANLMAVAHGLLTPEQSEQTLATLRASPLWRPMPGRATWPNYAFALKGFNVKFAAIADYHDAMYWLWITALAARAEAKVGNREGCERILDQLSEAIAQADGVPEVYRLKRNGKLKPVRTWIYRAENPLTWSAAMYLEAAAAGCH